MEEFVNTIKNNIENSNLESLPNKRNDAPKSTRLRKLLFTIMGKESVIDITEKCDNENGDVRFNVYIESLGLNIDDVLMYQKELNSCYMANFLGEFFVREHINKFAEMLVNIKSIYLDKVNKLDHKKFGMSLYKDRITFTFHSSLIQTILMEEFRRNVK